MTIKSARATWCAGLAAVVVWLGGCVPLERGVPDISQDESGETRRAPTGEAPAQGPSLFDHSERRAQREREAFSQTLAEALAEPDGPVRREVLGEVADDRETLARTLRALNTVVMENDHDRRGDALASFMAQLMLVASDRESYWNDRRIWQGVLIVQNHDLIDPQRFAAPDALAFARRSAGRGMRYHDATSNPVKHGQMWGSSRQRMHEGKAPIDPAGQPVILCRVSQDTEIFFEIEARYLDTLFGDNAPGLTREEACQGPSDVAQYWRWRAKGFVGRSGLERRPTEGFRVRVPELTDIITK